MESFVHCEMLAEENCEVVRPETLRAPAVSTNPVPVRSVSLSALTYSVPIVDWVVLALSNSEVEDA